ncbi:MAG TPA: cytidine deaminase [Firmicutes bacterium]|nr:cytidine deaminase [Bacillota bacterium]
MEPRKLLDIAREAQQRAYAPYSRFPVGAALLAESGKVYTGCNVEISSYGLTVCAERVAFFKAISEGERAFKALAVVAPGKEAGLCGACRQVIWDFAPDLVIYGEGADGKIVEKSIRELLPDAFDKRILLERLKGTSS